MGETSWKTDYLHHIFKVVINYSLMLNNIYVFIIEVLMTRYISIGVTIIFQQNMVVFSHQEPDEKIRKKEK